MKVLYDCEDYRGMRPKRISLNSLKVRLISRLIHSSKQFLTHFFFVGLVIKRDGIHILRNAQGRVSGEAFVHFETVADCVLSLQRNMKLLGHRFVFFQMFSFNQVLFKKILR